MGYWKNKDAERRGIWQGICKWENETETSFFTLGDVIRILKKSQKRYEERTNAEIAQDAENRASYSQ